MGGGSASKVDDVTA